VSRRHLSVLVAAILATLLAPVVAVELWYRSLLPEALPAPSGDPVPPLVRAALWAAECHGKGPPRVTAHYPFLLPEVVTLLALDHTAALRPEDHMLAHLARVHMEPRQIKHLQFTLRSMALATWMSRHWSVHEALDTYGARLFMGDDRRGLRAGAAHYLGRSLEALEVADVALLVAITRSPSRLDPSCFPERARVARNDLLARMAETGALDSDAALRAAEAPLVVKLDCNRNLTRGL
jgi:hypothetical protein